MHIAQKAQHTAFRLNSFKLTSPLKNQIINTVMKKQTITLARTEIKDLIHLLEQATEVAVDGDSELAEVYINLTDKLYAQLSF